MCITLHIWASDTTAVSCTMPGAAQEGPSWNLERVFEPWLTEGQSRLGWRNLRAYGVFLLGEQLGQWAQELCYTGFNVTSMSPNMAGG